MLVRKGKCDQNCVSIFSQIINKKRCELFKNCIGKLFFRKYNTEHDNFFYVSHMVLMKIYIRQSNKTICEKIRVDGKLRIVILKNTLT